MFSLDVELSPGMTVVIFVSRFPKAPMVGQSLHQLLALLTSIFSHQWIFLEHPPRCPRPPGHLSFVGERRWEMGGMFSVGKNVLWHLRNLHTEAELRERCLHAQPWDMLSETHFTRGSQCACPNDSHKRPDIPQRLKTFHTPSGEPSSGVKHTDCPHLHSRPSLQLLDDLKQVTPRTEPLLGGPGKKVQFKMINFVTDRLVWKAS